MDKSKGVIPLLAIAFAAGGLLVWFLIAILDARPKTVGVGPVEFEVPSGQSTATPSGSGSQPPVQVIATATPQPTIPATVVAIQPQSQVQLVESERTGASTRKVYDVSLASDEVIVGDAYDFQDKGYNCVVFIIRGPGSFRFSVLDGAWYRYSGIIHFQHSIFGMVRKHRPAL